MSPLETHLDIGIMLRSKVDESGNVYSLYPITRDIDVALTTEGENGELTLDDKLKTYDAKHQEYTDNIENLQKSTWSGTKEELMTAIENGEIADGTTVYITDDYSGDGQDLSVFATIDYVNDTFVPLEEGKGLSSTDVTSDDVARWNTSSDITARLDGDATVDGSVAQKIAGVISGAPEKYDTLVEIANWIESDTDGAAAMDLKISENAKNIELKLDKDGGDTMDNIVTFTSNDTTESTSWTDVDVMVSGEKHNGLFSKISTMFNNIRYLYKLLGTTSISSIGDGTVSGAISTLNSNKATRGIAIGTTNVLYRAYNSAGISRNGIQTIMIATDSDSMKYAVFLVYYVHGTQINLVKLLDGGIDASAYNNVGTISWTGNTGTVTVVVMPVQ